MENLLRKLTALRIWILFLLLGSLQFQDSLMAQRTATESVALSPLQIQEGWIMLYDGESTYGWEKTDGWKIHEGTLSAQKMEGMLLNSTTFGPCEVSIHYEVINMAMDTTVGLYVSMMDKEGKEHKKTRMPVKMGTHNFKFLYQPDLSLGKETERIHFPSAKLCITYDKVILNVLAIHLKPLCMTDLFNGKDLTGWKAYPEMPGKFTVIPEKNGVCAYISVKNGPGMLETEHSYGNFIFQTSVYTGAPGLNSGVFFRCIPGEKMNGYESQIHNLFLENDRSRPVDSGTGAIFRRTQARRVVADDQVWFYKTIAVYGNHISVWVNGYQVTDWLDNRKPDRNPRRGLRTEPGTVMLQAHDPTTDVRFSALRITELGE